MGVATRHKSADRPLTIAEIAALLRAEIVTEYPTPPLIGDYPGVRKES